MYKLLIVEDEEIYRRVLPEIIDWKSIGFVVSGVAENGRRALEFLEEHPVDVILTDIRTIFAHICTIVSKRMEMVRSY